MKLRACLVLEDLHPQCEDSALWGKHAVWQGGLRRVSGDESRNMLWALIPA